MANYVFWITLGVFAISLIIGLLFGLKRGLKRSSLHIVFMLASFLVSFLVTKPITDAVLAISIPYNGSPMPINEIILDLLKETFDLSAFDAASSFLQNLPAAIASPILFILLSLLIYFVFDIIYIIVARISFGKKKVDFKKHKPHRWYGGIVGVVEAFLFVFILFAPITSLTNTYQEIAMIQTSETQALNTPSDENKMKTVAEYLNEVAPEINEIIFAYNDSILGKVSGVGGLNNAIFDKLSGFEVDGEKINFREEVVSLVDVYDEFVVTYNDINAKNYANIDLSNLKTNIEVFLDNGIFKAVLSETVKDFVLNFEELNIENAPEMIVDIISELKTRFKDETFDVHEYLKHDILKLVDTADAIFRSGLIESIENLESEEIADVLEVVLSKEEAVNTIADNILSMNIVADGFKAFLKFASTAVEDMFKNSEYKIGINVDTDRNGIVSDVLDAIKEFVEIEEYGLNIADLLKSTDIVSTLTSVEDISGALAQAGKAFDAVRNLDILILPETATRTEKVYVFDNLLKNYKIDILNDEVYLNITDQNATKLNTYSLFFNYLKTPVEAAKTLDLLDNSISFDKKLDKILFALKLDKTLLSKIMIPFYQLDKANFNGSTLKTLVFDKVVNTLASNTNDLLKFDEVKTINTLETWNEELNYIGKVLDSLNDGEVGTGKKTYIKYMLSADANLEEMMKVVVNTDIDDQTAGIQTKLSNILNPIFDAKVFADLEQKVFDTIDDSIVDLTGVDPNTDTTNLKTTQDNVIETIEKLLQVTLKDGELGLVEIGKILDALKVNAYNDVTADDVSNGTKDGVFNNIFTTVIWYMTGDDINESQTYSAVGMNENYEDIKNYISQADGDDYYSKSYETIMTELENVIAFAIDLEDKFDGGVEFNTVDDIVTFITSLKEVVDAIGENKTKVITDMEKLVTETKYNFIDESDKDAYGNQIIEEINKQFTETGVADALLKLFQIDTLN